MEEGVVVERINLALMATVTLKMQREREKKIWKNVK